MTNSVFPTGPSEAETLARDVVRRLESSEPLSAVLPAARRLAGLVFRPVEEQWLTWEITGWTPPSGAPDETRQRAYSIWEPLHTSTNAVELAKAMVQAPPQSLKGLSRLRSQLEPVLVAGPMTNLEATSSPIIASGVSSRAAARTALSESMSQAFTSEVIQRVKAMVHSFVSSVLSELSGQRTQVTLLGVDAPTVFATGGPLLGRLAEAVDNLGWPGHEASACIAARSALDQMGLDLYKGDGKAYVSPIDQKEYNPTTTEGHRIHAVLDELWLITRDERRRQALGHAHTLIRQVRSVAARAKTQVVMHEDAVQTVRDAYGVAHAICFVGGFPARDQPESE